MRKMIIHLKKNKKMTYIITIQLSSNIKGLRNKDGLVQWRHTKKVGKGLHYLKTWPYN